MDRALTALFSPLMSFRGRAEETMDALLARVQAQRADAGKSHRKRFSVRIIK